MFMPHLCLCNFAICLGQIRHRSDPLINQKCSEALAVLQQSLGKTPTSHYYTSHYMYNIKGNRIPKPSSILPYRCVWTPMCKNAFTFWRLQGTTHQGPCCQTIAGHRQRFSLQPGPRLRSRMVMFSSTPWQHPGTSRATSAESINGRHGLPVFSGSEKSKDFILGWNLGIPPGSLSIQLLFKSLTQVSTTSMTHS